MGSAPAIRLASHISQHHEARVERRRRRFGGMTTKNVEPLPGMFIYFDCALTGTSRRICRRWKKADGMGHDQWGPVITKTGWWTLGISFSSDGNQVNYFAARLAWKTDRRRPYRLIPAVRLSLGERIDASSSTC